MHKGISRDFYKPDEPEYVDIDDDEIDILGEIQAEIHFAEEIVNEMASEAEEAELDVTLDTDSDFEPSSCESEEEVEDDAEAEGVNEDEDNEEETEKSTRNSMEEDADEDYAIVQRIITELKMPRNHPKDIQTEEFVTDLSFHPISDHLAVALITGDVLLYKYSLEENTIADTYEVHTKACRDVEFSEDGDVLYSTSKDKSIMITDVKTGKLRRYYDGAHETAIYCVRPINENLIATGDDDGHLKVWDLRTQEKTPLKMYVQSEQYEEELTCMGLYRNDSKLVVGTSKGRMYSFNWGEFGYHCDVFNGPKTAINAMLPVTQRMGVLGCEDGLLRAVNTVPGRNLGVVGQHSMAVETMDISNTGEFIASSSHDNDIRFWNIKYFEDFDDDMPTKDAKFNLPSSKYATHYVSLPMDQMEVELVAKTTKNITKRGLETCSYGDIIAGNKFMLTDEYLGKLHHPGSIRLGGEYFPPDCAPKYSVAVIVVYRDRERQLRQFLTYMHNFLREQRLHYRIFVVEQFDRKPFNRAKLFNIGSVAAMKLGFPCLILHDVDLLPMSLGQVYACTRQPRHMCASLDQFRYNLPYLGLFGGAVAIESKPFVEVNGMSNMFNGWGGEDDDFFRRLQAKDIQICRFDPAYSRYTMIKHAKERPNEDRLAFLRTGHLRYDTDGLNSLIYEQKAYILHDLFTHLLVNT
uniref:Uncharacterized protein n=1 Tax=Phlebotomus papatasi TaxID=29031 RepID=A0A1B0DIM3_PHLPP